MKGFLAVWRGVAFLAGHRRLWGLAAAPLLLNIILFALFLAGALYGFGGWLDGLIPGSEAWWWSVLYYLAWLLAVLVLLLMQVFLFTVVGRILASPFLDVLTKRVEIEVLGGKRDFSEMPIWRSIWRTLAQETARVIIYLVIMLLLLVLNLLPVLGSMAYSVLAVAVTCFFLASEFLDYPLERRGLKLGRKLSTVMGMGLDWMGFGGSLFLLAMVPLLNLVFLPAAAVGGTLLYLERRGAAPATPPKP